MVFEWLPLDWVTGVIAVLTLGYVYVTWNYDHWKKRGVPYMKPLFFLGNYKDILLVKKNVGTLMQDIYRKWEGHPYVGLFRFRNPALLVRDPEIIKTILVKEFPSFGKNAFTVDSEMDPLFAKSPFFAAGETWKHTRSLLSPSFTSGKLKPLYPLMDKAAKDLSNYLENKSPKSRPDGIETKELCSKYTTDVVASCAFGVEAGCFQDTKSEFREMNKRMLNTDLLTNLKILFKMFFPAIGVIMRLRLMPLDVANFYRKVVKEVMAYRQSNKESRNDFLQLLILIKEKARLALEQSNTGGSPGYTDEDVTAHAITFITEGFETSSITMSFFLYQLAMNPDVQDRLREELEEAMENNEGKLTYDVINSLPYLNMALSETLRMHAPVMAMEKFCTKKCDLPKESGGTFPVEPGTLVIIPINGIHYDPKYYPDPEKFDPERFSEERKDSIPKYTYLPFGDGPRVCIGMRFAQIQVKTGIAHVVLNYDIRPSERTPKTIVQEVNYFLAAAKGGLWLDFVKRQK